MDEKCAACWVQPRKVGTKATPIPWALNALNTELHQAGEARLASKAVTTKRPSASLYAAGLLATDAMTCVTVVAFVPREVRSGMTTILKRGSTASAACSSVGSRPLGAVSDVL